MLVCKEHKEIPRSTSGLGCFFRSALILLVNLLKGSGFRQPPSRDCVTPAAFVLRLPLVIRLSNFNSTIPPSR